MFSFITKKWRFLQSLISESFSKEQQSDNVAVLSTKLEQNLAEISEKLGHSADLVVRRFVLQVSNPEAAALVFIDGLADTTTINSSILHSLMRPIELEKKTYDSVLKLVEESLLSVGDVKRVVSMAELLEALLTGDTAFVVESQSAALLINTKGWEKRGVTEPETESILKGPHEGFTETLRTNSALLRRKIGHPALTFEKMVVGKKTRTDLHIAYLKGVTNGKLVEEVRRRIKRINTDAILAAGFVEQYIEDAPFSPFMTIGFTERPDVCAARLLEGRVAILVDGTPVVNTVPHLFIESFQSPDDYNFRWIYASVVRWFRYISYMLSVLLPAFYVALTSYHHEMIPTSLLITMAAANEGTPFPAIAEVIGMGFVFEVLREAGLRLPRPLGQAVSIVGALVIGQTTVSAGLVGAPVVIVIAFTAITSFVVPTQADSAILVRLTLTVLAGIFGAYGIVMGLLAVFIHLAGLRSFGVPYLAPIAPLIPGDLKDVAVRVPLWAMLTRPRSLFLQDRERQEFRLIPEKPTKQEQPK